MDQAAEARRVQQSAAAADEGGGGDGRGGCEFCNVAQAVVYCRADASRLCLACDRRVHAANSVSSRHGRALLCDACCDAASVVFCAACRTVLCSSCDFDAHGRAGAPAEVEEDEGRRLVGRHDRREVDGFYGCPVAAELVSALRVAGDEKALTDAGGAGDEAGEQWCFLADDVWEAPMVFSLDDLIVPTSSASHGFPALGMFPPFQKRDISSCGRQRDEILKQIQELQRLENVERNGTDMVEPVVEFPSHWAGQCQDLGCLKPAVYDYEPLVDHPTYEDIMLECNQNNVSADTYVVPSEQPGVFSTVNLPSFNETTEGYVNSSGNDCNSNEDVVNGCKMHPILSKCRHDLTISDRNSVISRYKEKRKTRRYDKHIRYESRKLRADGRMRIKGKFAKVDGNGSKQI